MMDARPHYPLRSGVLTEETSDTVASRDESRMNANVGDRIVLACQDGNGRDRIGEIIETPQTDGSPPYLIRWEHDRTEVLLFPDEEAFFVRPTFDGTV